MFFFIVYLASFGRMHISRMVITCDQLLAPRGVPVRMATRPSRHRESLATLQVGYSSWDVGEPIIATGYGFIELIKRRGMADRQCHRRFGLELRRSASSLPGSTMALVSTAPRPGATSG